MDNLFELIFTNLITNKVVKEVQQDEAERLYPDYAAMEPGDYQLYNAETRVEKVLL